MKKTLAPLVLAVAVSVGSIASTSGSAVAAEVVGNPKAAPGKIEMCIGCHAIPGYKTAFPEVYPVPKIGGQSARYIEAALKSYRKGDRKHPSMTGIARSMSDQDIADVAAYYSQQNSQQNSQSTPATAAR
jgi:cytochrome c553